MRLNPSGKQSLAPIAAPSLGQFRFGGLSDGCGSLYEIRRRPSDRRVFLLLGFATGWGSSLLLGPAVKGLIQGFLLGLV